MRILVIEDELSVASFIKKGLEEQSFQVDMAYDGQTGLMLARQNNYHVVVLDLILPLINGLQVCKILRETNKVPVLMLTALGTTNDIVSGLDSGADDYLTKPFKFQELLARIKALSRRNQLQVTQSNFVLANLEVKYSTKEVFREGTLIRLTVREFNLLEYFISNMGILVSRADIMENVWDNSFDSGTNVVDVYINYLRTKIDKNFTPKLIHTIYGMGYIFKAEE